MPVPLEITLQTSPEGPWVLYGAFSAGDLPPEKLRSLIPLAWCYHCLSAPENVIGSERWVEMFRVVGLCKVPDTLPTPIYELTLYRGTHEAAARGMSWTDCRAGAEFYRDGRLMRGHLGAYLYRTVVGIEAILAVLKPGADSIEYVIDPTLIDQVEIVD
jgi:hypothetical protein